MLFRSTSLKDLPADKKIIGYIQEAMKLNDDGVPLPKRNIVKNKTVEVPGYFSAALKKNKNAFANFEAFPPSHKKEYVQWITEAKKEETRQSRIVKAIEMIGEGKGRNYKYERK